MDRIRATGGTTGLPVFEGVPIGCPTVEAMRQTYRTLLWLADNYESTGSPEYEGLLEGARCLVTCAFDIYHVHLDVEVAADRRRNY